MDGLMMDYQLNVPAILRRADELYGEQRDREPPARQELAPLLVRRLRVADEEARRRAARARGRGRRPRRDVHVEPLPASRGVHGRAGRRVRHPHAEPPPPPRRQHLHRHTRRRPRAHRRQGALAARRAVRPALQLRARRSRSARARRPTARSTTRSCSRTPTSRRSRTATSRRDTAAAMCFTSGTTGKPKGVLYSHRAIALHALTVWGPSASPPTTSACRSSRCSTRMRGASRSSARWRASSRSSPAPTWIR